MVLNVLRWFHTFFRCPQVTDGLDECTEVTREQVEAAGRDISKAAVRVLAAGFRSQTKEVHFITFILPWCPISIAV